jgi:hypothetical protein
MFTEFAKDIWENGYKVNVAVRIAIFPPWKIEDVEGHTAINFGSLAILGVLYIVARQFTPEGGYGFEVAGVITVFTFIFLIFCGLLINFADPSIDAPKLSNRWSTFLIVSFMYATIFVILLYFVPPFLSSGRFNAFDALASFVGERGSLVLVAMTAAALAVGILYWRARHWFSTALTMKPAFLVASLVLCVLLDATLIYVLIFAI